MDARNPCNSTQRFSPKAEHEEIGCQTRKDEAQCTRTSNVVGEELKMKRNAQNKKTRQDEAQYTRTSNVVGEKLKTKRNA